MAVKVYCVSTKAFKRTKRRKVEANKQKLDTEDLVHEEHDFHGVINTEDIKYGYCTEMMVRFGKDKKNLMNKHSEMI